MTWKNWPSKDGGVIAILSMNFSDIAERAIVDVVNKVDVMDVDNEKVDIVNVPEDIKNVIVSFVPFVLEEVHWIGEKGHYSIYIWDLLKSAGNFF